MVRFKKSVKVAFVGAGNMAREHICAFADIREVELAGIHSRTRSRAEALAFEYKIPLVCDSIEELYLKTQADLVVITVFELAMNPVSLACFEFPWVVFMEKPPGYNLEDAESIAADAKKKDRKVYVALNRRFLHATQHVKADLESIEGPRYIRVQDQEDQTAALVAGQPELVVDNWMYANSIHVIDYFLIFGRGKVTNITPIIPWNPTKPDIVVSYIEFESGDRGIYEGIWNGPGPWATIIATPDKRWEIRPLETAVSQLRGERRLQAIEPHPWDQAFKPGFRLQVQEAVAAALGQPTNLPSLDEAIETMKMIQKIFES